MDTRKVTLVATIAVIALVAVGIGYAYTAMTTNSDNTAKAEYVELTQGGEGKYTFANNETTKVYYNSSNTALDTTTYYLAETSNYNNIITGATVVKVGNEFNVTVKRDTGEKATLNNGTFTTSGFVKDKDWNFYIVTNSNGTKATYTLTATDTWSLTGSAYSIVYDNDHYVPVTVTVYYGYAGQGGVLYNDGTAPSATPLNGASITFKVERTGSNDTPFGISFSPATIVYDPDMNLPSVTVKKGDTTLTPTTHYTVSWKDSESNAIADKAAFDARGADTYTVTITGAGIYAGYVEEVTYVVSKAANTWATAPVLTFTEGDNEVTLSTEGVLTSVSALTYKYYTDSTRQTEIIDYSGYHAGDRIYVKATAAATDNYDAFTDATLYLTVSAAPSP